MECPSCGTEAAPTGQRFCSKCGANLAPAVPPTAYGQGSRITGPLFADDAPDARPAPPAMPAPAPPTFAAPRSPQPSPQPGYSPLPPGQTPAAPPAFGQPPFGQPPFGQPPFGQPPPAGYDDNRRRRRRTSIVLLVAAAVVAALIGAGGVVLVFGGDDDPTGTSADDRAGDGDRTGAGTDPSAPTGASPTGTETAEPRAFRCWNGGPAVTRLASCTPPFGAAGMAWVFPSSTGATCATGAGAQRASEAECAPVIGADPVRFHYSEWRSRTALESYYGGNTVAGIEAPDGRDDLTAVRVSSRASSVGYKVAIYYADASALWSVTIYAADESQYLAAVDELAARPFRQLRGKRA